MREYQSAIDEQKHLNDDLQKELTELKARTELSLKVSNFLLIANMKSWNLHNRRMPARAAPQDAKTLGLKIWYLYENCYISVLNCTCLTCLVEHRIQIVFSFLLPSTLGCERVGPRRITLLCVYAMQ